MKMKYTLIAAMFAACTLALAACGEKKQAEAPAPAHEATHEAAPAPEATHEAAPAHEAAPEAAHTPEAGHEAAPTENK
jgi:hypothetical protein